LDHHLPIENYQSLLSVDTTTNELMQIIKDKRFFGLPIKASSFDQSGLLDKILRFKIESIERHLRDNNKDYHDVRLESGKSQTWIGLHPQVLQTPYSEILDFLLLVKKYQINKIIDFGAGYGRVGIVMQCLFPDASFDGYELVDQRVNEGNRLFDSLELKQCHMHTQNILDSSFEFPEADLYFIYDFSELSDIKKMLDTLSKKLYTERFFVVARGEGIRSMIQLRYPEFWAAHAVIHGPKWSLYSSFTDLA
jgi:hypothetical protein